jgi:hypothetical protein
MNKARRSDYFGSLLLGVVWGLLCAPVAGQTVRAPETTPTRQTPNTSFGTMVRTGVQPQASNFGVLLGGTTELQRQLETEAAKSARAAQTFGTSLSAADRRDLQSACSALVANPDDATASRQLEQIMSRYRDNNAEAIMRFCLEPTIAQLRAELQASRQTLERLGTAGGEAQANIDMQNKLQQQQQTFSSISNVMKTKHDTAKNSVSNIR